MLPSEGIRMNSVELKVKTAAFPLWTPCASESTSKEESYGVG